MKAEIQIRDIKRIVELSGKSKKELREMNRKLERAYTGEELTKYQLIFQIVFLADAPNE
jgi:hypothetical protein